MIVFFYEYKWNNYPSENFVIEFYDNNYVNMS